MKNQLLLLLIITSAFAAQSQNLGFPYNEGQPIFNTPADTTPAVKGLGRLLTILNDFSFDAYIQPEWQVTDTAGSGAGSVKGITGVQGGQFPTTANNRFLLRRSRFRLAYEHRNAKDLKVVEFYFQFDASVTGFTAKEIYGRLIDPWTGWFGIQGGITKRPFGYETPAPSQYLESPEVSRVNQAILPNDYELGEAIVIESPSKFTKFYFRADASLVNGEGIGVGSETGTYQSKKDFIVRVKAGKAWNIKGGGNQRGGSTFGVNGSLSLYNGGVLQTTENVYEVVGGDFKNITKGTSDTLQALKKYYNRTYYGAHLEGKADYFRGTTAIRAEYIMGTQPGTLASSQVPTGIGTAVPGADLYIRNFNGAIFYLTQTIKSHLKDHIIFQDFTVKYDWYNPNTALKQSQLTASADFSSTDVEYSTIGFGYTIAPYSWFKLVLWYDHVINASTGLAGYKSDYAKQDVFTIRTQFNIDSRWFKAKSPYQDNLLTKGY